MEFQAVLVNEFTVAGELITILFFCPLFRILPEAALRIRTYNISQQQISLPDIRRESPQYLQHNHNEAGTEQKR